MARMTARSANPHIGQKFGICVGWCSCAPFRGSAGRSATGCAAPLLRVRCFWRLPHSRPSCIRITCIRNPCALANRRPHCGHADSALPPVFSSSNLLSIASSSLRGDPLIPSGAFAWGVAVYCIAFFNAGFEIFCAECRATWCSSWNKPSRCHCPGSAVAPHHPTRPRRQPGALPKDQTAMRVLFANTPRTFAECE